MTARTSAQALAEATSAVLGDYDVTGLLVRLLRDCVAFLPVDAAAILVRTPDGRVELLSASSHRAAELEVHQAQADEGPCLDVLDGSLPVRATGTHELVRRWPTTGRRIVAAGFAAVHASPMRWRATTLGGLNLFSDAAEPLDEASARLAQNFADVATLAVAQPLRIRDEDLARRLEDALAGRAVVEQAKGALAFLRGVDMAAAYDALLDRAEQDGASLTDTARAVLGVAQGDRGAR